MKLSEKRLLSFGWHGLEDMKNVVMNIILTDHSFSSYTKSSKKLTFPAH